MELYHESDCPWAQRILRSNSSLLFNMPSHDGEGVEAVICYLLIWLYVFSYFTLCIYKILAIRTSNKVVVKETNVMQLLDPPVLRDGS